MAILSDQDRFDVWAEIMRGTHLDLALAPNEIGQTVPNKADLRAAIDAIDQWVSDNATSFNNAIPQPARGAMTAPQKAAALMYVVAKRYLKGV